MANGLYQLVAIDKYGNEYVIELKNDNKNNKSQLSVIDYGTTTFKNDVDLAHYLFGKGKIPTKDVTFRVKYIRNGVRYLPIIYDDEILKRAVKDLDGKRFGDLLFYILARFEELLNHLDFYSYILHKNQKNNSQKWNGNYLNNKFVEHMNDYYDAYIRTNEIDVDRSEFRIPIYNDISKHYKTFRTLYTFIREYDLMIKNNVNDDNLENSDSKKYKK